MKDNDNLHDIDETIKILNSKRDAIQKDSQQKNKENTTTYNGKIFENDEIDPSKLIDEVRREKEVNLVADSFPKSKTKLEKQQKKRELEKQRQILLAKQREDRKKHFKRIIATILTGSTVIAGGAYAAAKIVPKVENNIKISTATDELTKLGKENLISCELGTEVDGNFKIGNNSVSDYSKLHADSPLEVYIYKLAMDNPEEFNKFIRSVSYSNGLYCYESYEQFLRINGYYDQTTNSESTEVFENMMKGAILEASENKTISSYAEDEFYTSELSQGKTR